MIWVGDCEQRSRWPRYITESRVCSATGVVDTRTNKDILGVLENHVETRGCNRRTFTGAVVVMTDANMEVCIVAGVAGTNLRHG